MLESGRVYQGGTICTFLVLIALSSSIYFMLLSSEHWTRRTYALSWYMFFLCLFMFKIFTVLLSTVLDHIFSNHYNNLSRKAFEN